MKTAGLTGCQAGWLLISLDSDKPYKILTATTLREELGHYGRLFTDTPIGIHQESSARECDIELKKWIGAEYAASVVSPPMRTALDAPSYVEANMIHFEITGEELPLAAWSQVPRIRLLDGLLREEMSLSQTVYQSDSELIFTRLNGRKIYQNRQTKKGLKHRLELLADQYPLVDDLFRDIKEGYRRNEVEELEILDAAALSFGASRSLQRPLLSLPEDPPCDPYGLRMAIYYI